MSFGAYTFLLCLLLTGFGSRLPLRKSCDSSYNLQFSHEQESGNEFLNYFKNFGGEGHRGIMIKHLVADAMAQHLPRTRKFVPLTSFKAVTLPSLQQSTEPTSNNLFPGASTTATSHALDPTTSPSSSSVLSKVVVHGKLRVLQFNMLADGLFGLRKDFGAFSRTKGEHAQWSRRREQLLHEVLQYDPDIITLQECDHYYDCFLPELSARGYNGLFAPKPASACLEVSDSSDGCAIFVKSSKLRISSSETITFAFSRADVSDGNEEMVDDDKQVRTQNQVALLLVCDLVTHQEQSGCGAKESASIPSTHSATSIQNDNDKNILPPPISPPIIIATTHLKAAKTIKGERYRYREVLQLMAAIKKVRDSMSPGRAPAVLLTGDLNAAPTNTSTGYTSLAYEAVKTHPLGLRSVLNDDVSSISNQIPVWTTWKARRKQGKESVTKHCIDYILYAPPLSLRTMTTPSTSPTPSASTASNTVTSSASSTTSPIPEVQVGIRTTAVLDLFTTQEVGESLLPSPSYPSDHLAIAADLEIVSVLQTQKTTNTSTNTNTNT